MGGGLCSMYVVVWVGGGGRAGEGRVGRQAGRRDMFYWTVRAARVKILLFRLSVQGRILVIERGVVSGRGTTVRGDASEGREWAVVGGVGEVSVLFSWVTRRVLPAVPIY